MADVIVWPGWLGGLGIGLYLLAQHWASNRPLGCSLSYGSLCAPGSRAPYFTSVEFDARNNWRLWFIVGIPLGGFMALLTSGAAWTPTWSMGWMYDSVLPQALWLKAPVLLLAGACMGYGVRLAGGCTSGSRRRRRGAAQPAEPARAAGLFFISGTVTVQLLFHALTP